MTSSVMVWGALFFSTGKILKTKELCVLLSAAIIVRLTNESINGDANIATQTFKEITEQNERMETKIVAFSNISTTI